MKIGIPSEIKAQESRVGLTPLSVQELTNHGHEVLIQDNAGFGAGFENSDYEKCGAKIAPKASDVFNDSDMIIKVKEPIASEYNLINKNQLLFTYFHFASSEALTHAMIERQAICLAYETVEKADRSLPLLVPMSEVAGRMATQQGAKFLEKPVSYTHLTLPTTPYV